MGLEFRLSIPAEVPELEPVEGARALLIWERAGRARDAARAVYPAAIELLHARWKDDPSEALSRANAILVRNAIATETCAVWWSREGHAIFRPGWVTGAAAEALARDIIEGSFLVVTYCAPNFRARSQRRLR